MTDNIFLVQELLREYGRKRTSPKCLMKIDFRKAFDSVQWGFLESLLGMLGLPSQFVHLIMQCVSSASFSVGVNGNLYGFFKGQSGIRQGDPLSPYLFICCMEYFSRMLKQSSDLPGFNYHPKCSSLGISHIAFADDVLLLCRGDPGSVGIMHQQLQSFGNVSGLDLNPSKSSIYFGGVKETVKADILQMTGFVEGSFPFTYLGVPLSPHRLLTSQYTPLLNKLESAIQGWMGKFLSYAGRLELLRSVLNGMVQFWIGIFPIPGVVLSRIIRICRSFLWSGCIGKRTALVAWHRVCLPKTEGGLGLLDLKARSKTVIAGHIWNIHLKTDSIWIQWVHHFYLGSCAIWDAQASTTSSPLWKAILSLKNHIQDACGNQGAAISLVRSWDSRDSFSRNAYDYFRLRGDEVNWLRVVWDSWSMPRYNFILWLAALGKLRTKDRLQFMSLDPLCLLCSQDNESHRHLFFECNWSAQLWNSIKSWMRINQQITSLSSALWELNKGGHSMENRLRRISLGITVYLIWEERNNRVFNSNRLSVGNIFRKFQVMFFTTFHFREKDHHTLRFGS